MTIGDFRGGARDELAMRLKTLSAADRRALIAKLSERRDTTERVAPLSYAQQRLWFLEQLGAGNPYYNETSALRLPFAVDAAGLRRGLNHVVQRHEALRTVFEAGAGEPRQRVLRTAELDLPVLDLSGMAPHEREREAIRVAERQGREPFELATAPLLRVTLIRFAERDFAFVLTMHHIVCDGWSMRLFFDELRAFYEAELSGRPVALEPLDVQYADFAEWQRRRLAGPVFERQLEYWREQLDGLPVLELPTDHRRPAVPSFVGAREAIRIPPQTYAALRALGDEEGSSPFMALLAAYQVLLHRYSGQDDIAVGSPIANRTLPEHEKLIGFFVNTLVLRTDLSGEPSFRQALRRVRDTALSAYEHQDLPFEKLVEELRPERDPARHPLFQATFQMLPGPATPTSESPDIKSMDVDLHTAKFDLRCDVWETPGGAIDGYLEYSSDLFERERVAMMARHFETLIAAAAAEPEAPISRLALLTRADEHRIVVELNRTEMVPPGFGCVHQAFEACAARDASAPAVVDARETLTYGELNRRANRLARHLRGRGVIPGSLVAVLMERSVDYVVAILAVCKAGAAWVPLDPAYPAERLAAIMHDAVVRGVLTHEPHTAKVPGGVEHVLMDAGSGAWTGQDASNLPSQVDPQSLAYVVFTSGSTGRPKGVEILHGGLRNLVAWHNTQYAITPHDRATLYASPAFDASVWELWPYLAAGASVWIPEPRVHGAPAELLEWMALEQITVTFLPTPVAEEVVQAELPPDLRLRVLLTGGDRLRSAPPRRLPFRFVNHYGPTECTVVATSAEVARGPSDDAPPIGRPIANTQAYVLDRALSPVPPGVKGELYLAGRGLARGYLGDASLTRDRFVPNPFDKRPSSRMYRTGDVVRQRLDGNLEFLGRADRQLKVRGFRIEPADVESVLDEHPSVGKSLVGSYETSAGESGLVAYVVAATDAAAPAPDVQAHRTREWQEIYDWLYGSERGGRDPDFDIVGWNSSYTGRPLSDEEMHEQVDATVARARALGGRRVLEIGCGTGLLLFRLAEEPERYLATDFSAGVVESVRAECARRSLGHVEILHQAADDFAGIEAGAFDIVVLNSVVQYFPDAEYLERVLAGALRALRPGGAVFVGDVRNLELLPWLHAGTEVLTAEEDADAEEVGRRVARAVEREQELVLDPRFFAAFAARANCDEVQIEVRHGRHHNEITKFRYDVVLSAGREGSVVSEWEERPWQGLEALERHLAEQRPAAVCLRGIPSARLAAERRLMQRIAEGDPRVTAAALRRELSTAAGGIEPEDLWGLERDGRYTVRITWGESGCYDVWCVARRRPEESRWETRVPAPAHAQDQPPAGYANDVLEQCREHLRMTELRQYLESRLPDHMVPSKIVWTDRLALTPNGKLDRRSLPPVRRSAGAASTYGAPRGDLEEHIASIWSEVLGLEHVGAETNFFDLGGHSLLLVKVHRRLSEIEATRLSVIDLFRYPTVRSLAIAIRGAKGA